MQRPSLGDRVNETSAPTSPAYQSLLSHHAKTYVLSSSAAVLSWDQETGMPRGGGELRSRQLGLLAGLVHERNVDPRVGGWLADCEQDARLCEDAAIAANLRGMRRDHGRATRLPQELVEELALHESRAQQAWVMAREQSDFLGFAPALARMVELQQQKADCLRAASSPRWDALADLYEPGMQAAGLQSLFQPLRERLVALRRRLEEHGRRPDSSFVRERFAPAVQERAVRTVLSAMGFDWNRGRLDRSAHPFCTGSFSDVRLTTRFGPDNFGDALGSTMHEGGHGLYEQGLDEAHMGTPLSEAASLGIHESQSRLWENHVGRSLPFWIWAQGALAADLGPAFAGYTADQLWRAANVIEPSLIRVEADELTYDLHVMIRFDLERSLIDGGLAVADLPEAWNARYAADLGVRPQSDRDGCLQDVHWSCGLFGYFPTYTLGNLYAAQFAQAAKDALPTWDADLAAGRFLPLRDWLRREVHVHGRRHDPADLCRLATGAPLSSEPFLRHLEAKLCAVYGC